MTYDLQQALEDASQFFNQDDLVRASDAYQAIIHTHPECGEAWYWLGHLSLHIQDAESALLFLQQARATGYSDLACLIDLGKAYQASGDQVSAREAFEEACARNPESYEAWHLLAALEQASENHLAALDALQQCCRRNVEPFLPTPGHKSDKAIAALNGLASIAKSLEDDVRAETLYRKALQIDPDHWESLSGLGLLLKTQGKTDDAIEILKHATQAHADKAEAWTMLGEAYLESDRPSEAEIELYKHTAETFSNNVKCWYQLGEAYRKADRLDEAKVTFETALALDPQHNLSINSLGCTYSASGDPSKAIELYTKALELTPSDSATLSNIALEKKALGDFEGARIWTERSLETLTNDCNPSIVTNLGMIDLALGNLERGWKNYDARPPVKKWEDRLSLPLWQGEPLLDKQIVVWQEQGIGDQLIYATQFDQLIRQAKAVVLDVAPKLVPLMRRSFPKAMVTPWSRPPHPLAQENMDFQISAGSLARWLRPSHQHFPKQPRSFLRLDKDRVDYWRQRIDDLSSDLKIGVCWRSSLRNSYRNHSYAAIEEWTEVFRLSGVTLVNLQYDECSKELEQIREEFGCNLVNFRELDMYNDLDETTAMISQLDGVISAPTAVSCQAGATGIPTFLLTVLGDWGNLGLEYNPWMPNIRKYYRPPYEPWRNTIGRLLADLKGFYRLQADQETTSCNLAKVSNTTAVKISASS